MHLGNAVKIALINKGVKQRELAESMGVTGVYVSRICNQESIGISSLKKIADALGMKVSELVELGEDKA